MIVAALNWANFRSAPLNSFHLTFVQSGGGPRDHLKAQLTMSYQAKPLPPALASCSMSIRLRLKEAEGNCARSNRTPLNVASEKFGA